MGTNSCFPEITADVFPPWRCVNTHLNVLDQQTDKAPALIEVLTLTDDQLISALISSPWMLLIVFISVDAGFYHTVAAFQLYFCSIKNDVA